MKNGKVIDDENNIFYYKNNKRHREDGPAVIWNNGDREWWLNDRLHRDNDKPAVIQCMGLKQWCQFGKLHREDGPAVINPSGERKFFINGVQIDKMNSLFEKAHNKYPERFI